MVKYAYDALVYGGEAVEKVSKEWSGLAMMTLNLPVSPIN